MCLQFMFLLTTRLAALLRLARHEERWKTAEILILRHQLAVLQRQPRRPRLDWADRALLAALLAVMPKARRHGLRLLVTPDTILRWHRDIIRRRAARTNRVDPAPRRTGPTWSQFLRSQAEAILACDLFSVDLLDGTQAYVLTVIG